MKYIKRKYLTLKNNLSGNIVDTLNITDKTANAPSINLVQNMISDNNKVIQQGSCTNGPNCTATWFYYYIQGNLVVCNGYFRVTSKIIAGNEILKLPVPANSLGRVGAVIASCVDTTTCFSVYVENGTNILKAANADITPDHYYCNMVYFR